VNLPLLPLPEFLFSPDSPAVFTDQNATNFVQRFYLISVP